MAKKTRKPPSVGLDKFIVRLPPGLRAKLHASAKANNRSANAELVDRLEKSMVDSNDLETLKAEVAALKNSSNLFQAAMANFETKSTDIQAMIKTMKDDSDAMVERMKQDRLRDRDDATLMKLKGEK